MKELAIRNPPSDPSFPGLHIRPPRGWVNDPNGVCLIDGRYHVFFQYSPDTPLPPALVWGHAESADLVRWQYRPVALVNRPGGIDAAGCWSGCVVDDTGADHDPASDDRASDDRASADRSPGVPTAVYTAIAEHPADGAVVLARSDRSLISWQQDETAVVPAPSRPGVTEARDPYVFRFGDHRYAVQGAGTPGGDAPMILLYRCDDLRHWTELEPLLTSDDPVARAVAPNPIWECPNLFRLDGRWVLLVSGWFNAGGSGSWYLIGDLQPTAAGGLRFVPQAGGVIDDGPSFYAPQVLSTEDRTLLWGWACEVGRTEQEILAAGWQGALTFPRELSITGDTLVSAPAAELITLRADRLPADRPITATAFEIEAPAGVGLRLDGADVLDEPGPARVLVDGSLVEVFRPDGVPSTLRAYPRSGSAWSVSGDRLTVSRLTASAG